MYPRGTEIIARQSQGPEMKPCRCREGPQCHSSSSLITAAEEDLHTWCNTWLSHEAPWSYTSVRYRNIAHYQTGPSAKTQWQRRRRKLVCEKVRDHLLLFSLLLGVAVAGRRLRSDATSSDGASHKMDVHSLLLCGFVHCWCMGTCRATGEAGGKRVVFFLFLPLFYVLCFLFCVSPTPNVSCLLLRAFPTFQSAQIPFQGEGSVENSTWFTEH